MLDQATLVLLNDIASKDKETTEESNRYARLTRSLEDKRTQVEQASERLKVTHTKVKEGNSGIEELERKLRAAKEQMVRKFF